MRQKGHIAAARGRFSRIRQVAPTCTTSSTWFLGPSRVHNLNGMSIASAIFARLPIMTDPPTDRYLRNAAMRPNNNTGFF